ncbi:MAG: DNA-binding response regulator [Lachnospiraceae bacterium]|nr:DNA-binding response regulator [Lachnospiraceae bacterium]
MQKVCVYDKKGSSSRIIEDMNFWRQQEGFALSAVVDDMPKLTQTLCEIQPDVCILAIDEIHEEWFRELQKLQNEYTGMRLIVLGTEGTYAVVRRLFLSGIFDYLLQPVSIEMLEQTLLRVYENKDYNYVVNQLQDKIEALIDHIFQGGGEESYIIGSILDQIYEDFSDPIDFQQVADKAKKRIYNIIIDRKSWLEKFLYEKDYTYKVGFSLKTRESIESEWLKCFGKVSSIVKKYQMIDDKLVYRIGKYVVVHVDEKLSLEKVSEGVFLNSSYISSIFKKTTGMNFTDFVAEVKVDRAKILLRDSGVKIYDVAATVGYSNVEYFTKTFKRKTGMAPIEYQKMIRKEEFI